MQKDLHIPPCKSKSAKSTVALIFVVFFSTFATMMITPILSVYFKELGLTRIQVGRIEGWANGIACLSKFLSGVCSDRIRKRKLLIVCGTALSIITKGSFALATGWASILAVQVCDRFAKGVRSCPLDAMISEVTCNKRRAYSLKHAVFLCACIIGSFVTYKMLRIPGIHMKSIFYVAMIPAIFAYLLSAKYLHDVDCPPNEQTFTNQGQTSAYNEQISAAQEQTFASQRQNVDSKNLIKSTDPFLWKLFGILFLLTFARFGMSFLGLKAMDAGIVPAKLPLLHMLYDTCAAISALFVVATSSRLGVKTLFKFSLIIHMIGHVFVAVNHAPSLIWGGTILFGTHLGLFQGTTLYMISTCTKPHNRATVFSIYYLITGVGLWCSNHVAGGLSQIDPSLAFFGGAVACLGALVLFSRIYRGATPITLRQNTCE
ncbi:MAG: MFS transporter [Holosporales bacterium]|jgi:predicted MFS family arabinose efflux permease|nr:MFS transporter [Holosporales bacterium]